MNDRIVDRREFFSHIGQTGVCMCTATAGLGVALEPGNKSIERAAKRLEFGDGWIKRFLEVMEQNLNEETRVKLMKANGRA